MEPSPVHLADDYTRTFGSGRRCRIRVYLPEACEDSAVVLLSVAVGDGDEAGEPHEIQALAMELTASYGFVMPPIWVEHCEDQLSAGEDLFNLIRPGVVRVGADGEQSRLPHSSGASRQQIDRQMVEDLIGQQI